MKKYWLKCNHCDHRDYLHLYDDELVDGKPTFIGAGIQCEDFDNHLIESHDMTHDERLEDNFTFTGEVTE